LEILIQRLLAGKSETAVGIKLEYPAGATPLDADDAQALVPSHITTQGQLNEWEFLNVREGEDWAFGRKHENILSIDLMQTLHKRMFGNTWRWAGEIRTKETYPVGAPPENIRVEIENLCKDVAVQLKDGRGQLRRLRLASIIDWFQSIPFQTGTVDFQGR